MLFARLDAPTDPEKYLRDGSAGTSSRQRPPELALFAGGSRGTVAGTRRLHALIFVSTHKLLSRPRGRLARARSG